MTLRRVRMTARRDLNFNHRDPRRIMANMHRSVHGAGSHTLVGA